MRAGAVLAIDGGNTKSVAVVADVDGSFLGEAVAGCGDIYGAVSQEDALAAVASAARSALDLAGVGANQVSATVASLAGADWPEDFALYETELRQRVGLVGRLRVLNDGLGPVWLADGSGKGVAVVVGTGSAIGARGPGGKIWHASFWLPLGAVGALGRQALDAVYRAALGLGPETRLTERLLTLYGMPDVESLLHSFTRREQPIAAVRVREAGLVLMDEDGAGDEVAHAIIDRYATALTEYVTVAARRVQFAEDYPVALTGGLLRHPTASLATTLAAKIKANDPRSRPSCTTVAPVVGALLESLFLSLGEVPDQIRQRVLAEPLLGVIRPLDGTAADEPRVSRVAWPLSAERSAMCPVPSA